MKVEDLLHPDDMCVLANGELGVRPPDYLVKIAQHWRLFEQLVERQPDVADLILAGLPIPVSMV